MTTPLKASLMVVLSVVVSHDVLGQTPAAPSPLPPRAAACTGHGSAGFLQIGTRTTAPVSSNPAYLRLDDQCWWDFNPEYSISAFPSGDVTYYFCNACAKTVTFGFRNLGSAQVLLRCRPTDLVIGHTVAVPAQQFSPPQICDTGSASGAFMNYDIFAQVAGGPRVNIDPEIVLDRTGRIWFRIAELQIAPGARVAVGGAVQGSWVETLRQQGVSLVTSSGETVPDVLVLGASTAGELNTTVERLAAGISAAKTIWLLRRQGTERIVVLPPNLEYVSEDQPLSTGFTAARVVHKAVAQR